MRCHLGLGTLLALAFGLAVAPVLAQGLVYTWVDGNGVRHYAQTPPDGVPFEVRDVRDQFVSSTQPSPVAQSKEPQRPEDRMACERARLAIEQLNSNVPLLMDRDGDGTMEPLDEAQRTEQRRLAEQAVRAFCVDG